MSSTPSDQQSQNDQVKLNAIVLGQGPALVMLHGWGHSAQHLRPLGELLAGQFQVHMVDLPGFGASGDPPSDKENAWGTEQYARRILAYMDEAKLSQVVLFGHSFGGRVSIQISSLFPERVRGVVLLNSHGLRIAEPGKKSLRAQWISVLRTAIKKIDATIGTKLFESWFVPRFASVDYKNSGNLRSTLVKTVNEDLSTQASSIKAPTFLLWGEKDTASPLAIGLRLKELIKDSKLTVLPELGHNFFLDSGSYLATYHLTPFLNNFATVDAPMHKEAHV